MTSAVGYTQVRLNVKGYNSVNSANLQTALDSTTDPYLVGGPNSAAVDDFHRAGADGQRLVQARVLPVQCVARPVRVARRHVAGRRRRGLRASHAERPGARGSRGGPDRSFSNNFTIGTQNVASVHAELSAPILKSLEADAAVRYDHYNLSGGKASPRARLQVDAIAGVRAARHGWPRASARPGRPRTGTAGQTFFTGSTNDSVLCPDPSKPDAVGTFPSQCSVSLGTVQSTTKT